MGEYSSPAFSQMAYICCNIIDTKIDTMNLLFDTLVFVSRKTWERFPLLTSLTRWTQLICVFIYADVFKIFSRHFRQSISSNSMVVTTAMNICTWKIIEMLSTNVRVQVSTGKYYRGWVRLWPLLSTIIEQEE